MDDIPFSIQELWQALTFLAGQKGLEPEKFITNILQEQKMNELLNLFSTLDEEQKQHILSKLGINAESKRKLSPPTPSEQACEESKRYSLNQLLSLEPADMTKSKPKKIWINSVPIEVKNWKEVAVNFVKALLSQNLLQKKDLPFYPNPASGKAYINSIPRQPISSYDGLFVKVDEDFYVDYKYNAKYHILNIWRTLEKLGLQDEWNVEFEMRDCL